MVGSMQIHLWIVGVTLVGLAGLNPPLAILALGLGSASAKLVLRAELGWLVTPTMLWVWSALLVVQFLADLYFVPATVRDRTYLHGARLVNAYLNARFQSFFRPLAAALALAALPSPLPAQSAAVLGFVGGTAIYWLTAWIREQVAISRGSVILLLMEMAKNMLALVAAVLMVWAAPLALGVLASVLAPVALWAARLRREQLRYSAYGGRIAPEDS